MKTNPKETKKGNDSAFPNGDSYNHRYTGLTKRELIAAIELNGLLGNSILTAGMGQATVDVDVAAIAFSNWAVKYADALLEELEK